MTLGYNKSCERFYERTANEMSTNNMKCTWPTRKCCIGDPSQPIFHWLALGFCVGGNANFIFRVGGNANFSVFRYKLVGISNAKLWHWGSKPTQGPNANGFASQWNIGLQCPKLRFYSMRQQGARLLKLCAREFLHAPYLYVAVITGSKYVPTPGAHLRNSCTRT